MRRRQLLGAAAIGATAIGVGGIGGPGWIARAFAQDAGSAAELAALSEAYRRAQRGGRPLLVIVIPADAQDRWARQTAFGELLNHGGRDAMADLALAEIACATMATLRTLVPQAGTGEPLMVLVEPEGVPAGARPLDATLAVSPERWVIRDGVEVSEDDFERLEREAIDGRIAILTRLVHDAIAPSASVVAHRASLAREHLGEADRARIDSAIARGSVDAATGTLAPAMLAHAILSRSGGAEDPMRAVLEVIAIQRWRQTRIPGSHWATGGGCGIEIEGQADEDRMMMACGMGHVPERSARFLYWYSHS